MHSLHRRNFAHWCLVRFGVLIALVLCAAAPAMAGTLSATYFHIRAQSTLGDEEWSFLTSDVPYDPATHTWSWMLGGSEPLGSVATLTAANLMIVGDPQIAMGFALSAGEADATITITTATLAFGSMANPDSIAAAGITLTRSGAPHMATLTGNGYNGSAYTALIDGTPWSESPNLPYIETETSASLSDNTGGWLGVPGVVSSMQVQYSFVLSAGDQASGTSNWMMVPEPTSLALLAIGALFLRRR